MSESGQHKKSKFWKATARATIETAGAVFNQQRADYKLSSQEKTLSRLSHLTYAPLPRTSCIRLVRLEPGGPTDIIRCHMRCVDLDDFPKYVALSYCWDMGTSLTSTAFQAMVNGVTKKKEVLSTETLINQDETPRNILCNDQLLEIQPNLHHAMLHMRRMGNDEYWIDRICMNQDDPDEMTAQIPFMGRVYSQASLVLVWLGPCPVTLVPGARHFETAIKGAGRAQLAYADLFKGGPEARGRWTIHYLLLRRWFKRLWVLQEMCLARELVFYLGEFSFTHEDLKLTLEITKRIFDDQQYAMLGQMVNYGVTGMTPQLKHLPQTLAMRQLFQEGHRWTLDQWTQVCKGRRAKDPRDLLFGGMAMFQEGELVIDQALQLDDQVGSDQKDQQIYRLWPEIKVNYHASVPEVLLNLAACFLSKPGGLRLLSTATRKRDDIATDEYFEPTESTKEKKVIKDGLASWIPNPGSRLAEAIDTLHNLGGTSFAACTAWPAEPKISADGRMLYLEAASLGHVQKLVKEASFSFGLVPTDFLQFLVELPPQYSITSDHIIESVARIHSAGLGTDRRGHAVSPAMPPDMLRVGFCHMLVENVEQFRDLMLKQKRGKPDELATYAKDALQAKLKGQPMPSEFRELTPEEANNLREQEALLEKVKARFPDLPWPVQGQKLSDMDSKSVQDFRKVVYRAMHYRSFFRTREHGYMLSAPAWVEEGDVVMLVKGATVPYVFTPRKLHLERRRKLLRKELRRLASVAAKDEQGRASLQGRLDTTQYRLDSEDLDCWVLAGEAYVEGAMHGEAAGNIGEFGFERIAVV